MRVALLALLGPLIFLLLADGRPQGEKQWDSSDNGRVRIAAVSDEEDFDSGRRNLRPITSEYSSAEVKELSRRIFNNLKSDGPVAEIHNFPLSSEKKDEKVENHHHKKSHHHHREFPEFLSGRRNASTHLGGCMASPFSQLVHVPGCETKFVLNRFCHGTCSSFYVPQLRSRKLKANFENYTVCRPAEVEHVQVKLECEEGQVIREITRIKRCACMEHDAPLPE